MYQPRPPIPEDLDTLEERLRHERDPKRKPRLPLLVLLKSGQVTSRGQAAAHLALHRKTVAAWLRRSRDGGLEALLTYKEAGAPAGPKTLPPLVFEQLKTRLATPTGFASYLAVQRWLREALALEVPAKTLHGMVLCPISSRLSSSDHAPAMQNKHGGGGRLCQAVRPPPRHHCRVRTADAGSTRAGLLSGCKSPGPPCAAPASTHGLRHEAGPSRRATL
jgi:hypothetical protein